MTYLSIFGDQGLRDVRLFHHEINKLKEKLELLQQENQVLVQEVGNLQDEPYYIEKIAREELGMARPGEKVFIITKKEE
jgi:cell division protein FtsB